MAISRRSCAPARARAGYADPAGRLRTARAAAADACSAVRRRLGRALDPRQQGCRDRGCLRQPGGGFPRGRHRRQGDRGCRIADRRPGRRVQATHLVPGRPARTSIRGASSSRASMRASTGAAGCRYGTAIRSSPKISPRWRNLASTCWFRTRRHRRTGTGSRRSTVWPRVAGARLIVHGHHHESYAAKLADGIDVRGLAVAETLVLATA